MWKSQDATRLRENQLSHEIIGAAIEVHKELGPGLLESSYAVCLARELELRGIPFEKEVPLPVVYKDIKLECGYRMDLVIDKSVIIEIKSVDSITDVHEAQCLTYLRFSGKKLCLLLNFNTLRMKDGIKRFVPGDQGQSRKGMTLNCCIFFVVLCAFFAALCVTH